ncbi:MAG: lipid-A-disaccharide synthase [Sphingobacteriales bacterium]|nr:MAG: lipid-A-disaccharide synthase [Sphingobacteriales bacterium]
MKYYLISGEASGDLHGSNLIKEIHKQDPQAQIRCWGGDLMQAAGAELVSHYKERAFMGFLEVAMNIRTILGFMKTCKKDLLAYKPDIVVLIDYPGFNIPMAQFAKKHGFKTIFYISPQVWAWKEGRVKTIREVVDKMLVILPFEVDFYKKWNYEVIYVGHPLVQVIEEFKADNTALRPPTSVRSVALLPGSRPQEIKKKLPIMLKATQHFPDVQFRIAQAPSLERSFYESMTAQYPNVELIQGKTYELLMQSHAALVTSGTATLETALFGVPEVVCYKGSAVSHEIAKRLIKVKYISLVNLILDKPTVKELIQHDLTPENITTELKRLLDPAQNVIVKKDLAELWDILSPGGAASANAAKIIVEY